MIDVMLSAVLMLISASQESLHSVRGGRAQDIRSYMQQCIKADQGLTSVHGNFSSYQEQLPK